MKCNNKQIKVYTSLVALCADSHPITCLLWYKRNRTCWVVLLLENNQLWDSNSNSALSHNTPSLVICMKQHAPSGSIPYIICIVCVQCGRFSFVRSSSDLERSVFPVLCRGENFISLKHRSRFVL